MRVLGHVAVSLAGAGILYNYTRSFSGSLWFLLAGVFIDADHYIDYIRERSLSFDFKKIYDSYWHGYMSFRRVTLVFHSYELLALLWLSILLFDLGFVWKCAAIGFTLHLFIDQMTNPIVPLSYFLWFRIANDFETKKIFVEREVKNGSWNR